MSQRGFFLYLTGIPFALFCVVVFLLFCVVFCLLIRICSTWRRRAMMWTRRCPSRRDARLSAARRSVISSCVTSPSHGRSSSPPRHQPPPSTHPSPHSSQSTPSLYKHTLHINSTQPHPHPTISARRVPPRGRPLIDSSFFNQLINPRPTISARRVPPRRRREFRPRPRIVGRYLLRRLTVAFQPADEAHRRLRAQVRRVRDHVHLPPAQRAGRRREETEEGEWRAPD